MQRSVERDIGPVFCLLHIWQQTVVLEPAVDNVAIACLDFLDLTRPMCIKEGSSLDSFYNSVPAQEVLFFKQLEVGRCVDRFIDAIHLSGPIGHVFKIQRAVFAARAVAPHKNFHPTDRLTDMVAFGTGVGCVCFEPTSNAVPFCGGQRDHRFDVATETVADGDVVVNGAGAGPSGEQTQRSGEKKNNQPSIRQSKAWFQFAKID